MQKFPLIIVIPCYNEFDRLPLESYREFLAGGSQTGICFVNDGSTDDTLSLLLKLQSEFEEKVVVIDQLENRGKASSVRTGVLRSHADGNSDALAYLDADLACSLEECSDMVHRLNQKEFVFASRILRVGSHIERRFSRFLIGRVIATIISEILGIKVYDTQCGCKVFRSSLVPILFSEPLSSRWLFDVELISRFLAHHGPDKGVASMEEIPIRRWIDRGESKVRFTYFFQLWADLWRIRKKHKHRMQSGGYPT
ncbi:glycosyltransferase [Robiginitalea biformata]|uniref:glycosyltransferase n=1 Tax=Robiginitalea biformata TaxID=252307 RepID=UPI003B5BD33C